MLLDASSCMLKDRGAIPIRVTYEVQQPISNSRYVQLFPCHKVSHYLCLSEKLTTSVLSLSAYQRTLFHDSSGSLFSAATSLPPPFVLFGRMYIFVIYYTSLLIPSSRATLTRNIYLTRELGLWAFHVRFAVMWNLLGSNRLRNPSGHPR